CQLRDPAIFEEVGRRFLLYSVAGEQGIGIAELDFRPIGAVAQPLRLVRGRDPSPANSGGS
ncbi:MAG: hypothetical protein ACYDAG_17750, partial [Chloroflexota bacterium]